LRGILKSSLVPLLKGGRKRKRGGNPSWTPHLRAFDITIIWSNIAGGQVSTEARITKEPIRKTAIIKPGSYIGKSVTAFIFKNTRYEVRYWIEVLSQICKLAYNLHRSSFESVLQLRGSKRPYFTRNPNELRTPQQIEDSAIYMETNLSSNSIVRISVNVILLFGYSEKDLIIEAH